MATEVSKPPEYARTTAGILSLLPCRSIIARSHQRCYRRCKRLFAFLPCCLYLLDLPVQLRQPRVAGAAKMTARGQPLDELLLALCWQRKISIQSRRHLGCDDAIGIAERQLRGCCDFIGAIGREE